MRKVEPRVTDPVMAFAVSYPEFDEFSEATVGWDLDFRQIGVGDLNARLAQVNTNDWAVSRAQFDRPAFQQGATVQGMRTFGLLDTSSPTTILCNRRFAPDTIAIFPRDLDFRSFSPRGFSCYSLSFREETLSAICQSLGLQDVVEQIGAGDGLRRADPATIAGLRDISNEIIRIGCAQRHSVMPLDTVLARLGDQLCTQLVLAVSESPAVKLRSSQLQRSVAVNRAIDIIEDFTDYEFSVQRLASEVHLSRRALEYGFKEQIGLSPKKFIKVQRLIKVRRDLRAASAQTSIGDIANRWGFWHMGQFARDYRHYFGELPSDTIER